MLLPHVLAEGFSTSDDTAEATNELSRWTLKVFAGVELFVTHRWEEGVAVEAFEVPHSFQLFFRRFFSFFSLPFNLIVGLFLLVAFILTPVTIKSLFLNNRLVLYVNFTFNMLGKVFVVMLDINGHRMVIVDIVILVGVFNWFVFYLLPKKS